MSQNAVLDREATPHPTGADVNFGTAPVARFRHQHLTLVDWELSTAAAPTVVRDYPPVVPARRPMFGWSEACAGLLFLAAGAACVASLLNL